MDGLLLGSPAGRELCLFTFAEPLVTWCGRESVSCHSVDLPLLGISGLFAFVGHTIFFIVSFLSPRRSVMLVSL